MVHDEPSGHTFDDQRSFLAVTLDAAAHEAVILLAVNKEVPEALLSSVVLLHHQTWENTGLFVTDYHLFGLEPSKLLDALVDVSRDQVLVATVHLGVRLLNESHPGLFKVLAMAEDGLASLQVNGQALVDDYVHPGVFLVDRNHEDSLAAVPVENGRVHSIRHVPGDVVVDDRILTDVHSRSNTSQQLITTDKHRHRRDQPAISELALHAVVRACSILNKLSLDSRAAKLVREDPINVLGLRVALHRRFSGLVDGELVTLVVVFTLRAKVRIDIAVLLVLLHFLVDVTDLGQGCLLVVQHCRATAEIVFFGHLVVFVAEVNTSIKDIFQVSLKEAFAEVDLIIQAEFIELIELNEGHA
mmetsp:Transcript_30454/g.46650  ORF Transcript_30454/g.46650 Transcript_30454/m.46650 type:complete len:358 (-) Transcript_30454:613-1686(-)